MISTFEEQLNVCGRLVYYNVGDSMMPLLKENRDLMVLEKPNREVGKYDAVLYKRENGQYVMHRIIGVRDDGFVLCGDNRFCKEFGVKKEQILAILTGVVHKGKNIDCNGFLYRLYVHLWCDFFFLRAFILKVIYHINLIKRNNRKNAKENR